MFTSVAHVKSNSLNICYTRLWYTLVAHVISSSHVCCSRYLLHTFVAHVCCIRLWYRVPMTRRTSRPSSRSSFQQVVVQRGNFYAVAKETPGHSPACRFQEPWLCQPKVVATTTAECVSPAILSEGAEMLNFKEVANLSLLNTKVNTFTVAMVSDKATSNVTLMKNVRYTFERMVKPACPGACLFLETCQAHSHARGKTAAKGVTHHTMRHFSMAHLERNDRVRAQRNKIMQIELHKLKYVKGPPHKSCHTHGYRQSAFRS